VTYELTGPDPVSWDDLAALASSISGKNVRYQPVDDRECREHVTALGVPEAAPASPQIPVITKTSQSARTVKPS
jgi:uncharacterized protein YbjT (DUF2867 family)